MPRQARSLHVGRIYHVIQRGVERRRIFMKQQDYARFVLGLEVFNSDEPASLWNMLFRTERQAVGERLRELREKRRSRAVDLMAFALMPNHFHFIVREIHAGGLSSFMRKMGGYATYFNLQYDRVGSLFQSRYKTIEVEDDAQLTVLFAYVHTNPIELWEPGWKDHHVQDPEAALQKLDAYRWSSYRDYVGTATFPAAIQRSLLAELMGGEEGCRKVVEDWVKHKAQRVGRLSETFE